MALSAEQFSAILDHLRSDATGGRDSEHRVAPRVGLRVQATVTYWQTDHKTVSRKVWIRDISVGGIGLVTHDLIEKGSLFVIVFEGGEGKVTVVYRVVRCQEAGKSQYIVGGLFEKFGESRAKSTTGPIEKPVKV